MQNRKEKNIHMRFNFKCVLILHHPVYYSAFNFYVRLFVGVYNKRPDSK
jgi:hypothetical protein